MSAPTLSIYRSHDRELLFHGDEDAARAEGIRIRMRDRQLLWRGEWRTIVNHSLPADGSAAFWIVL